MYPSTLKDATLSKQEVFKIGDDSVVTYSRYNTMSSAKVSVCIPSFNYARFLPDAIESVLKQSFADFELIIIDNCSTDHTVSVVEHYAALDKRIVFIQNDYNLGMVDNWNKCISIAKCEYIRFLFADDLFNSTEALAKMVSLLDSENNISLVASARNVIDENSNTIKKWSHFPDGFVSEGTPIIKRCLVDQINLIGEPSAVMFRKSQAIRGFNPKYKQFVDLEMWFHLLEQGRFAYFAEPLTAFRVHAEQQTVINAKNHATLDDTSNLFKEYLGKPYLQMGFLHKHHVFYDFKYQIWKDYKRGKLEKNIAFEKLRYCYSLLRFFMFLPIYKLYKPIIKLTKKIRFQSSEVNAGSK